MPRLIRSVLDPDAASPRSAIAGLAGVVGILGCLAVLSPWRAGQALLFGACSAIAVGGLALHVLRRQEAIRQEARDLWGLIGAIVEQRPWPSPGGWALGADALSFLLTELPKRNAQTVVELGPGTSSVVLARCLPQLSLTGLEHDPGFLASVAAMLRLHDSEDYRLIHAPLRPVMVDGHRRYWYDPEALRKLPSTIDALIVDGPPNLAGSGNRLPAWHMLRDRLKPGALILVDDTHRNDERRMVDAWLAEAELRLVVDRGAFMVLERVPLSA